MLIDLNLNNNDLINDNLTINKFKLNCDSVFKSNSEINNNFFVVHQNIRSLRQNFDSLVAHLDIFTKKPDLVFVSEIWIFDCEKNDYMIPGYKFHATTNDKYSAGGVGVFVKNEFDCEVYNFNLKTADIIKLCLNINNEAFTFVCVYRCHRYNIKLFFDEFSNFLCTVRAGNLIL